MIKRLLAVAALGALLAVAFAYFVGWALSRAVQVDVGAAPADLGAQTVSFASRSGAVVHGWWCPREGASGAVVLAPGVRANRLSMVERARFLRRAGYSVLLVDLQATGETIGREITFGWRERDDVLAAVAFVRRAVPGVPVAVLGSSLGGAAALLALPELKVEALVLEAVYPTLRAAVENRLTMRLGSVGRFAAPLLLVQAPAELRPVDHIAKANCPVLIIGGALDRHTAVADTQLLYRHARAPKAVWIVPNAAHVDFHRRARDEYEQRVGAFLRGAFAR